MTRVANRMSAPASRTRATSRSRTSRARWVEGNHFPVSASSTSGAVGETKSETERTSAGSRLRTIAFIDAASRHSWLSPGA